jgi:glycine/D-amino acid oxidase-like deaminating enzyme
VSDVVIVGGGITGALVALTFAREGIPVILLEADCVGCGSTAASSALLLQEPDRGLAELTGRYGRAASRRIWELGRDGARDLVRTLHRHRIACDLVEGDAIYYATTPRAFHRLRAEFHLRSRAGFAGEWLTAGAVRRATGVAARGAIRTSGNAQFDPYTACLGLMRVAASTGAARSLAGNAYSPREWPRADSHAPWPHRWFTRRHRNRLPGHLFALGYGGNGMTFGSLAARLLLEHWRGQHGADHRLFHFSRLR